MLDVCEIFTSIQGEGPKLGQPAVFLRLAGCMPPFCEACDTPEALTGGRRMSLDHVERRLHGGPPLVVVTGGEPFLQWDSGLAGLTKHLAAHGRDVQFETSGRAGIPPDAPGTVVCSPKPMARPAVAPDAVARADAFKFVILDGPQGDAALETILTLNLPADQIWLMPEGRTRVAQLARMPRVWEMCAAYGFRFSPRLHILTHDQRKGI